MFSRDKVVGAFLGVAIGDALGMPVETWTAEQISSAYDWVDDYIVPASSHKWFSGWPAGEATDDTQLTLTVADAIIENGGFDMDSMAKHHIAAFDESTGGWGSSTRESVRALKSGCHWTKSATTGRKRFGGGNGVPMKILPLTVAQASDKQILDFNCMTHFTQVSALAALVHNKALMYCFRSSPQTFDKEYFCQMCYRTKRLEWQKMVEEQGLQAGDDIFYMFDLLADEEHWAINEIIEVFKGGCYVYESLPFCHALFLRDEAWLDDIEPMIDAVNGGGDTDTNASIVGGMIGALYGKDVFPDYLINGLRWKDKVVTTAERLCDRLGIV